MEEISIGHRIAMGVGFLGAVGLGVAVGVAAGRAQGRRQAGRELYAHATQRLAETWGFFAKRWTGAGAAHIDYQAPQFWLGQVDAYNDVVSRQVSLWPHAPLRVADLQTVDEATRHLYGHPYHVPAAVRAALGA